MIWNLSGAEYAEKLKISCQLGEILPGPVAFIFVKTGISGQVCVSIFSGLLPPSDAEKIDDFHSGF